MKHTYSKPPITHEEQLDILSGRGLVITNHDYSLLQLRSLSYYRLSAYTHFYRERKCNVIANTFTTGTTFEKIIELYEFDQKLRLLIIEAIECIEVTARAHII